ncbi:hypothetical protein D0859_10798 [Hortaea werneckii]|uniref:Extracellular membrane protein CFEM domain-containing protein n=1 Tax=Hortaea werneckii TaxID=91943 RepID=A0A3M7II04_HORWE|nr:hypothetical protein D0859_10798 [Hortaea werneckii]
MRSTIFTLAALAAASLTSAAVSAPDYPDCSVNCVEKAIGQTNCAMDDYYCQSVLQEVNKLCKSALQAKGETYTAPDVGLEACAGGGSAGSSSSESGSSTTGGASTSATGTSTSSSSSSTDEDASSEQEEEDGSGDSEESGAEGLRKVYQGAVVIGALAVGVAIL